MIYKTLIILTIVLLLGCTTQKPANPTILYINAMVLDLNSRGQTLSHIEVASGKITNIYHQIPEGYVEDSPQQNRKIIDLANRFVLPGMIDMHVHAWGNVSPNGNYQLTGFKGTANANLYAGISGFVDLFSDEDYVLRYRNKQLKQQDIEARLFAAGPCFTATGGHCSEYGTDTRLINTPQQAISELALLAKKNPDVVKVVYDHMDHGENTLPTIDQPTLAAFLQKAKQLGIKSIVHIGTWDDVRDAAKAGANAVTHTPMTAMPDDIASIMLANNVAIIPTLLMPTDWPQYTYDSDLLKRPLLTQLVTKELLAEYPINLSDKPGIKTYLDKHQQNASFEQMGNAIKQLAAKGVTILVGSDASNLTSFQGFSFHRELELLVGAGVSPWQALKGASLDAQQFMGLDWQITVGHQAEFVVFNESPIQDISNTQSIYAMVHKGQVVNREALLNNVTPTGWAKLKMYLYLQ